MAEDGGPEVTKRVPDFDTSSMDAKVWAEAFVAGFGVGDIDEGLMLGWFANAIMAGYDHGKRAASLGSASAPQERDIPMVEVDGGAPSQGPEPEALAALLTYGKHLPVCREGCPVTRCDQCGGLLDQVRQKYGGYLNRDQFDAVKAGDWYCAQCRGDRGESGHRYFWESELAKEPCDCGLAAALTHARSGTPASGEGGRFSRPWRASNDARTR